MKIQKFKDRVLLSPPHMSGEEIKYVQKAFDENWVVPLGPNVDQFENEMRNYLSEDVYPVAMNSGTSAIHIALILMGIEPGEEVFCSSATFIASANPIMYEKAKPVFIDSELDTWNLCPDSLQKAIDHKKKTGKIPRFLICADLFGMSANYEKIEKICSVNDIKIIEDSAESLGSSFNGKKCGTFGDFGVLSFNGNKIITTSGGGMLIAKSKELAEKAIFLITQAREKAPYYLHEVVGYNYRMSNICAGIGIAQLNALNDRVSSRRSINKTYNENLKELPLSFLTEPNKYESNFWLTTALLNEKEPADLINHLNEYNIEARHIWKPLHTQPIFKNHEMFSIQETPVSEVLFNKGICLPSGSNMSLDTVQSVCEIIKDFY